MSQGQQINMGYPSTNLSAEEMQSFIPGRPAQYQVAASRQLYHEAPYTYMVGQTRFERQSSKSLSRSNARRWIIGALFFNIVLTCAVVFGLLYILKISNSPLLCVDTSAAGPGAGDRHTAKHTGGAQTICVKCEESDEDDGRQRKEKCCSVDATSLKKLIDQMTKETIETHLRQSTRSTGSSSPGSSPQRCGALYFLQNKRSSSASATGNTYTDVLGWGIDGNVAYQLQRSCDVRYNATTGKVTVNEEGFYVVYSHLAFLWKQRGSSVDTVSVSHKIVSDLDHVIAEDKRLIQRDDPGVGSVPSYNSRTLVVLFLRRGTVLRVQTNQMELLMNGNGLSSFGLFRI